MRLDDGMLVDENVYNIGNMILETVRQLFDRPCCKEELQLLLGTALVESDLTYRKQLGGGPARGYWQMEPTTAVDIFDNYLHFRYNLWDRLCSLWLHLVPVELNDVQSEDLAWHLECNDKFACAMARIHYLRDPNPIPTTLEGQAAYWKSVYNTFLGAGTVSKYLEKWKEYSCDLVVEELFRDTGLVSGFLGENREIDR